MDCLPAPSGGGVVTGLERLGLDLLGVVAAIILVIVVLKAAVWLGAILGAYLADVSARRLDRHYRKEDQS